MKWGRLFVNILLCCSAGMSTSLLVTKMEKEAEKKGIESKIWAVSVSEVREHIGEADVILLGPQVRYMLNEMKKLGESELVPVDVINQMDYGLCNGEAVLKQGVNLIQNFAM